MSDTASDTASDTTSNTTSITGDTTSNTGDATSNTGDATSITGDMGETGTTSNTDTVDTMAEMRKKVDRAIHHLRVSSCLMLKPSRIHGVGVFARTKVVAGQKVWVPIPPVITLNSEIMAVLPVELRAVLSNMYASDIVIPNHGTHVVGVISYINHRNIPNATFKDGVLTICRDIRCGSEVTIDYRCTPGWKNMCTR
jgi:hypothetical protein